MPKPKRSNLWLYCLLVLLLAPAAWIVYGITATETPAPNNLSTGPGNPDFEIFAIIGSQTISREEVDRTIKARIFELEKQIYSLRKQRLDQTILQIVIQKEADKRGLTPQVLVNQLLGAGIEVTPEEVNAYYNENSHQLADWKGSREELEQKIMDRIAQQKGYQKVIEYANSLHAEYGLKIYLQEPLPPMVSVSAGKDPAFGPYAAPVTIVEFSDYQCTACRKTHEVVKQIKGLYRDNVKWVFKDFPLTPSSRIAAEAARCANEQGKFAEYQDLLFSETQELTPDRLTAHAKQLGLQMDSFKSCFDSQKYRGDVEKNLEEGSRIGVSMTPTYIINGQMFPGGPPLEEFRRLVSKELVKAGNKEQKGSDKSTM